MMTDENRQLPLEFRFTGSDYDRELDDARLTGQILRIYDLMQDGAWRTLAEIEAITGDPQASISAQLRHLRKKRFGYHTVNKQSRGDRHFGLFEYQLIVNESKQGNFI
jgi:Fic family protein